MGYEFDNNGMCLEDGYYDLEEAVRRRIGDLYELLDYDDELELQYDYGTDSWFASSYRNGYATALENEDGNQLCAFAYLEENGIDYDEFVSILKDQDVYYVAD